jgi:hypothetical protein
MPPGWAMLRPAVPSEVTAMAAAARILVLRFMMLPLSVLQLRERPVRRLFCSEAIELAPCKGVMSPRAVFVAADVKARA